MHARHYNLRVVRIWIFFDADNCEIDRFFGCLSYGAAGQSFPSCTP